jgi:hypothetical protein
VVVVVLVVDTQGRSTQRAEAEAAAAAVERGRPGTPAAPFPSRAAARRACCSGIAPRPSLLDLLLFAR